MHSYGNKTHSYGNTRYIRRSNTPLKQQRAVQFALNESNYLPFRFSKQNLQLEFDFKHITEANIIEANHYSTNML